MMKKNLAIILAGGTGSRIEGDLPKQFLILAGKTILQHSIERFENHPRIDHIFLVIYREFLNKAEEIVRWDAQTDTAVWTLDMQQRGGPLSPDARKGRWPWREHHAGFSTGDKFDSQPFVLGQLEASLGIDAQRNQDSATSPVDLDGGWVCPAQLGFLSTY